MCYDPRMRQSDPIRSTVWTRFVTAVALAALTCGLASAQQDQVTRANAGYASVPESRRSDLILLPAIAAMDEAPVGADDRLSAMLIDPSSSLWPDFEAWAMAPAQRAALEALRQVTATKDPRRAMSFAQPYGAGVGREMIQSRLYTALGDPPLLAGAQFHYLDGIEQLDRLVHIEATRLGASGDTAGSIDLLVRSVYLGRQLVDRAFAAEVIVGFEMMISSLERIRDVAYVDFQDQRTLGASEIEKTIAALDGASNAYLNSGRIPFPTGNKLAAQQLWELLYEPRGSVRVNFATTMARLRTADRPLRLFAEASRFESSGDAQADWFQTRDMIDTVFDSWSARWTLNPFDRQLSLPYAYDDLNKREYQVIAASTTDLSVLYGLRRVFETEVVGTRAAFALLGYYYSLREFPPAISAVRPRWLSDIEADPFNPTRAAGRLPAMEFFVPLRDSYVASERDVRQPHRMNVYSPGGENFSIMLRDDQFVLYSVGRDGMKNLAEDVSIDPDAVTGDYLIWPPMYSLYRTHLRETNRLP